MIVDRSGVLDLTGALNELDVVNEFIYLESSVNNTGDCTAEINRRITMAKSSMARLTKIWKDRAISLAVKTRLVRTLVFSIFLYGAETWTVLASGRKKIDTFEMWCWRRMIRIPWTAHRTNASILQQLKIKRRLSTIYLQRVLQFFGHISRRRKTSLERLVVTGGGEVQGRCGRGRSPTRWSDQVKRATGSSLYESLRRTEVREDWMLFVGRIGEDHDPQS